MGQCFICRKYKTRPYGSWEFQAVETNGIEEEKGPAVTDGNRLIFCGSAFQPKTFRVVFQDEDVLETPENTHVDLPYNAMAFTPDEFNPRRPQGCIQRRRKET